MGHKVHPDVFRLGISKDWQYQIKDPLLANIFIFKTINNLFKNYSAPYISYKFPRNVNPRTGFIINKVKMIQSPFFANSLVLSHLIFLLQRSLSFYFFV